MSRLNLLLAKYNTPCGTVTHAAPEVFSPPYTSKADIWSIGVIVAELWTTLPPFKVREEWWASLRSTASAARSSLGHFLFQTLNMDPEFRTAADQCLSLEFLTGNEVRQLPLPPSTLHQHEVPVHNDEQTNQNTTRLDAPLPDTLVPLADKLQENPHQYSQLTHCNA